MTHLDAEVLRADPRNGELRNSWLELQSCSQVSPFLRWAWISAWLEGIPEKVRPFVVRFSESGRTSGLAMFATSKTLKNGFIPVRYLSLSTAADERFDRITIEHNNLLMHPGAAPGARDRAVDWLLSQGKLEEFRFPAVSDEELANTIRRCARIHGFMVRDYAKSQHFVVDIDLVRRSGKPYLDSLSSNTRYQIRKALKGAAKLGGLHLEVARSAGEVGEFFAELVRLHQQYWREKSHPGAFADPFVTDFHARFLGSDAALGEVQLLRMSAGSTVLGYLYNLVVGDRVYSYQSGFDYRHADLKPGIISHVMAIDHYLAGSVETYDLLEGESQYKRSLSHLSFPMYWLAVNPGLLRFRLESFLRNRLAKQKD